MRKVLLGRPALAAIIVAALINIANAQPGTAMPPPGMPNGMPGMPGMPSSGPSYFLVSQVDWLSLLPPPPAANSIEQQRDLQAVLDTQAASKKNSAVRERAIGDAATSCFRIADVLGAAVDEKQLRVTASFLNKAAMDASQAGGAAKRYWHRPRPYVVSNKVERLSEMTERGVAAPASVPNATSMYDTSSYPSGHSMFGTACGYLLAQMVPEKQAEIYARTEQYRQARIIMGAHFPTDIEAGRIIATAAMAVMSQNFEFQHDLVEARAELRKALNLPETPPSRGNTATALH